MTLKLSEINVYPIKSTRRIALHESEVLPRGLPWDRRWMLVDRENKFITARKQPMLATVQTAIGTTELKVTAEGMPELSLPLQPEHVSTTAVTVWRDTVPAVQVGRAADEWFSAFLSQDVRLVQMTDDIVRPVDQTFAQAGDEVSFADGFPLLLISEASLDDLNRRLPIPVSMRRFRPNIVVSGSQPYAEDAWTRIRIGEVEFAGVKTCSRCIFTTIDPDSGKMSRDQEPLRTLGTYRRDSGGVYFGQNMIPRSAGRIRVGDEVERLA